MDLVDACRAGVKWGHENQGRTVRLYELKPWDIRNHPMYRWTPPTELTDAEIVALLNRNA